MDINKDKIEDAPIDLSEEEFCALMRKAMNRKPPDRLYEKLLEDFRKSHPAQTISLNNQKPSEGLFNKLLQHIRLPMPSLAMGALATLLFVLGIVGFIAINKNGTETATNKPTPTPIIPAIGLATPEPSIERNIPITSLLALSKVFTIHIEPFPKTHNAQKTQISLINTIKANKINHINLLDSNQADAFIMTKLKNTKPEVLELQITNSFGKVLVSQTFNIKEDGDATEIYNYLKTTFNNSLNIEK